jgi:hypothetical protein
MLEANHRNGAGASMDHDPVARSDANGSLDADEANHARKQEELLSSPDEILV